ncbi:MAG: bifunctional DNA-formamidopyrimidine glycosylase/DNA-(apurinic or apyrimidinic site) lyase [Aurantimicrobium sp.]|nr:bifunctional DNA-formamidopyrimidine glycosylase/DNA-(apurinic or apyrimidinic site) lyase [Aurantimicrobium sp.]
MPELPEVEVVRAGLAPAVTGSIFRSVQVLDTRSLKRHDARRGDFVGLLEGATVLEIKRRGKFLWMPLGQTGNGGSSLPVGSGDALVVHLGMSGQVLLREPQAPDDKHLRVRLVTEMSDGRAVDVRFVDQRIFGSMAVDHLVDGIGGLVPAQAAHIAADPLEAVFDDDAFVAALRKRRTGIKRALLDQGLISGIGNIYADESLWRARLHYDRPTDALTAAKARELLGHVREVLAQALAEGGTSFDAQYVNVNGQAGYFEHSLNAYGRQGEACARCGGTLRRESFMNRGSHFCPICQRMPRKRSAK